MAVYTHTIQPLPHPHPFTVTRSTHVESETFTMCTNSYLLLAIWTIRTAESKLSLIASKYVWAVMTLRQVAKDLTHAFDTIILLFSLL